MIKLLKKYLLKKSRLFRALTWISYHYYDEHNRKDFKEIGDSCIIHHNCWISHGDKLVIKNNVQIHGSTILHCQGGLYIGNNVGIATGCLILTADHAFRDGSAIPYGPTMEAKPVYINDNVWIGANVCILPGTEIGEGAIVGVGSVVMKDVPPCAIVFGNPARIIGYRDEAKYEKCKSEKRFVKHQYCDKIVVPKYTQIRPKLLNLIKPYIDSKKMVLKE
jgi:maltose O-acetyltransferase